MNRVKEKGSLDGAAWGREKLLYLPRKFGTVHIPGLRCRSCGLVVLDTAKTD